MLPEFNSILCSDTLSLLVTSVSYDSSFSYVEVTMPTYQLDWLHRCQGVGPSPDLAEHMETST